MSEHYYCNEYCDVCKEQIHHCRGEVSMNCEGKGCDQFICEDCINYECHVCSELEERFGYADPPNMCSDCMESCEACEGVVFHSTCRRQHKKSCNPVGRAKRAVDTARDTIKEKKRQVAKTKRRLMELEEELRAAKKAKLKEKKQEVAEMKCRLTEQEEELRAAKKAEAKENKQEVVETKCRPVEQGEELGAAKKARVKEKKAKVKEKKQEVAETKHRLAEQEEELKAAKKAKVKLERKLQQLQQK